jgi:membrane-associated phospholipid phosphatase
MRDAITNSGRGRLTNARLFRRLLVTLALPAAQVARAQETGNVPLPTQKTGSHERLIWIASGALLAGSFALDERLRAVAESHQSHALDRVANAADLLGTTSHIVPALAGTYVVARLTGHQSAARSTLRVAVAYAPADAIESVLKPLVGRERPHAGNEPLTFRPFTAGGDFHSFPSAHVVHIASLTTAVDEEADRRWLAALGTFATAVVAAQRVYRDQHWTSDVVASDILGVATAGAAWRWAHAHIATHG